MTETTVAPNNKAVVYRSKAQRERPRMGLGVSSLAQDDRKMPVVSKAQNAAMHAAAEGKSTLGISKAVGQEFTADQKPGSVKKLPERVEHKARKKNVAKLSKRGAISRKAASRRLSRYIDPDQDGDQHIDASTR